MSNLKALIPPAKWGGQYRQRLHALTLSERDGDEDSTPQVSPCIEEPLFDSKASRRRLGLESYRRAARSIAFA